MSWDLDKKTLFHFLSTICNTVNDGDTYEGSYEENERVDSSRNELDHQVVAEAFSEGDCLYFWYRSNKLSLLYIMHKKISDWVCSPKVMRTISIVCVSDLIAKIVVRQNIPLNHCSRLQRKPIISFKGRMIYRELCVFATVSNHLLKHIHFPFIFINPTWVL